MVGQVTTETHIPIDEGKHRLSPKQVAAIVQLRKINPQATQADIATAVGTTQTSVSRWLAAFSDSSKELALDYYDKAQLEIAATVVDKALHSEDERIQLKAAELAHKASRVIGDEAGSGAKVGIVVHIGQPGAPAGPDPFERLQVIDSTGPEAA
jgi:DNA-binding MarR family transcriptional regulator